MILDIRYAKRYGLDQWLVEIIDENSKTEHWTWSPYGALKIIKQKYPHLESYALDMLDPWIGKNAHKQIKR
jgi:hypothetical protein